MLRHADAVQELSAALVEARGEVAALRRAGRYPQPRGEAGRRRTTLASSASTSQCGDCFPVDNVRAPPSRHGAATGRADAASGTSDASSQRYGAAQTEPQWLPHAAATAAATTAVDAQPAAGTRSASGNDEEGGDSATLAARLHAAGQTHERMRHALVAAAGQIRDMQRAVEQVRASRRSRDVRGGGAK